MDWTPDRAPSLTICQARLIISSPQNREMASTMADEAIERIRSERGLAVKIAKACGIKRTAVYQWRRVPVERVAVVAKILKMSRKQIRRDIFGG